MPFFKRKIIEHIKYTSTKLKFCFFRTTGLNSTKLFWSNQLRCSLSLKSSHYRFLLYNRANFNQTWCIKFLSKENSSTMYFKSRKTFLFSRKDLKSSSPETLYQFSTQLGTKHSSILMKVRSRWKVEIIVTQRRCINGILNIFSKTSGSINGSRNTRYNSGDWNVMTLTKR